jgi:hypothetical protein
MPPSAWPVQVALRTGSNQEISSDAGVAAPWTAATRRLERRARVVVFIVM